MVQKNSHQPLAAKLRPDCLSMFVGQKHIIGEGTYLKNCLDKKELNSSLIFYGPPGVGKTTLAKIIIDIIDKPHVEISAISGTVADLRKIIKQAEKHLNEHGIGTILFVDEIHRFSKSQQDILLHAVEEGILILIGATTENPYFEVNSALNSRSRILTFSPINDEDIHEMIVRALYTTDKPVNFTNDALTLITKKSNGDLRFVLNIVESAINIAQPNDLIDVDIINKLLQQPNQIYDKTGDQHYDTISAFIKSIRGSDADAAIYYLAKMLTSGEDPKYICRRMMISASEDIGNADPQALLIATAAFQAFERVGLPEGRIILSQAASYLALAPKSVSSYEAINSALVDIQENPNRKIPNHLRDRRRPDADNYDEYLCPHYYPNGWVSQQYLPDGLYEGDFYEPYLVGWEAKAQSRLNQIKASQGKQNNHCLSKRKCTTCTQGPCSGCKLKHCIDCQNNRTKKDN